MSQRSGTVELDLGSIRDEAEAAIEAALDEEPEEAADVDITEADIERAEEVVVGEGFETTDFPKFRAAMLAEGFDNDEIPELWSILRNEDKIPRGSRTSEQTPTAEEDDGGDGHDHDRGGTRRVKGETLQAEFEGAEAAYLIKTEGCPGCMRVEEALDPWIQEGLVDPINFPDNPRAEKIAESLDIREVPALVVESEDGSFREL